MLVTIVKMALSGSQTVAEGRVDLSEALLDSNQTIVLNGEWEFSWNQLLTPSNFGGTEPPQMDSFIKVPGTWSADKMEKKVIQIKESPPIG